MFYTINAISSDSLLQAFEAGKGYSSYSPLQAVSVSPNNMNAFIGTAVVVGCSFGCTFLVK